jgi:hypothetical protein
MPRRPTWHPPTTNPQSRPQGRVPQAGGFLDPAAWANLVGLVQLAPTGEILPARAMYRPVAKGKQRAPVNWGIGVNPLYSEEPLWYTIPDAIATRLLSDRPVSILKAVRFEADGVVETLRPVTLLGGVRVEVQPSQHRADPDDRRRSRSCALDDLLELVGRTRWWWRPSAAASRQ